LLSVTFVALNFFSDTIMARDEKLKERWDTLVQKLSDQFAEGEDLDLDAIIYLIGVQELGQLGFNAYSDL